MPSPNFRRVSFVPVAVATGRGSEDGPGAAEVTARIGGPRQLNRRTSVQVDTYSTRSNTPQDDMLPLYVSANTKKAF